MNSRNTHPSDTADTPFHLVSPFCGLGRCRSLVEPLRQDHSLRSEGRMEKAARRQPRLDSRRALDRQTGINSYIGLRSSIVPMEC